MGNDALRTAQPLTLCRASRCARVCVWRRAAHSAPLSPSLLRSDRQSPLHSPPHFPRVTFPFVSLSPAMDRIYCSEQIEVPPPLPAILKAYTKEVIRYNPRDIPAFSRESAPTTDKQRRGERSVDACCTGGVRATTSAKPSTHSSPFSLPASLLLLLLSASFRSVQLLRCPRQGRRRGIPGGAVEEEEAGRCSCSSWTATVTTVPSDARLPSLLFARPLSRHPGALALDDLRAISCAHHFVQPLSHPLQTSNMQSAF